ncbi:MAG: hypothetical protein ACYCSN_17515 [Acidobacteriaceae bacterium]
MKVSDRKMERKWEAAIAALLTAPTIAEAAKACGAGETTLYRWLSDADFQTQFRAAKRAALEQAISRLSTISGEAVETLRSVMKDEDAPASARVTAAKAVLDTVIKAAEVEDLSVRVAELERLLTAQNTGRTA